MSTKVITTLFELLSKVAEMLAELAASNTTAVPKLIEVPLTVPTIAVP